MSHINIFTLLKEALSVICEKDLGFLIKCYNISDESHAFQNTPSNSGMSISYLFNAAEISTNMLALFTLAVSSILFTYCCFFYYSSNIMTIQHTLCHNVIFVSFTMFTTFKMGFQYVTHYNSQIIQI